MGAPKKPSKRELIDRFRVWAFKVYYHKMYASEIDRELRFAKAIGASAQEFPKENVDAILNDWWDEFGSHPEKVSELDGEGK